MGEAFIQVPTKRNRKDYLDYAKAIGIFLVVWGHFLPRQANPPQTALEIKMLIYSFHMPLFFMVSGMGLYYKLEFSGLRNLKTEAARLSKRLLAPYVFWCIIYIALLMRDVPPGEGWGEALLFEINLAFLGGIAPIWFLHALFFSEAAFLLLWNCLRKVKRQKSAIIWLLLLTLLGIISALADAAYKKYFGINSGNYLIIMLFRLFPSFFFVCAGYAALLFSKRLPFVLKRRPALAALCALCAAAFCAVHFKADNNVNLYMFEINKSAPAFLLTGLTGSLAVVLFCALLPRGIGILRLVSGETISIMALHYPPMPICDFVLGISDKLIGPSLVLLPSLLTTLACGLAAALVLRPLRRAVERAAAFNLHIV